MTGGSSDGGDPPQLKKFLSEARRTDAPFPKPYFEDTLQESMGVGDREDTMRSETMGVNDREETMGANAHGVAQDRSGTLMSNASMGVNDREESLAEQSRR